MTLNRPKTLGLATHSIEAAEMLGVPHQRIQKLWMTGKLPVPTEGRYRLGQFLPAYIHHIECSTREEAAKEAALAAKARIMRELRSGL